MMSRLTMTLAAVASALIFATTAFADDQYVDKTGFAVSGYDVVAYFSVPSNLLGQTKTAGVPGNPNLWRIVDDKLYLNITDVFVGFWEEDIPGNLNLSETNWVSLDPTPASSNSIPKFTSTAPESQI